MKIKDFIKQEIDIDVCDDYDESCYIAFVGPVELTDEGKQEFADVMDCDVEIVPDCAVGVENDKPVFYDNAIVHAESDAQVRALVRFFNATAGYCSESDYDKWFVDSEYVM